MNKFPFCGLILAALVLSSTGCAKSKEEQERRGLHAKRASVQTGSNIPRTPEVAPAEKKASSKKKKARPEVDSEFVPRGGFR